MAKATRNAKAKAAKAATTTARAEGAADDHGQAGNVAENAGGTAGADAVADVAVPEGAVAAEAAMGMPPADAGGAQPDPALAEEHVSSSASNSQEKPPRSDNEPEAHVDDRAGLQADTGAGDPDTNTPRGSSGTAREASSTGGRTTAEAPSVGAQPGSPNGDIQTAAAEAAAKWPRFFAASEAWKAAHPGVLPTVMRITSKVEGFRRAGMAHPKATVDHPIGTFDADQTEQLLGEPNLKVEFA